MCPVLLAGRVGWVVETGDVGARLRQSGGGGRRAVLLLWLWAAVASFGCVAFVFLPPLVAGSILIAALALTASLTRWLPRFSAAGHRPKTFAPAV